MLSIINIQQYYDLTTIVNKINNLTITIKQVINSKVHLTPLFKGDNLTNNEVKKKEKKAICHYEHWKIVCIICCL